MDTSAKIIDFLQFKSDRGLEALNRLTGLNWGSMPRSLVNCYEGADFPVKKPEPGSRRDRPDLTMEVKPVTAFSSATGK